VSYTYTVRLFGSALSEEINLNTATGEELIQVLQHTKCMKEFYETGKLPFWPEAAVVSQFSVY